MDGLGGRRDDGAHRDARAACFRKEGEGERSESKRDEGGSEINRPRQDSGGDIKAWRAGAQYVSLFACLLPHAATSNSKTRDEKSKILDPRTGMAEQSRLCVSE